MKKEFRFKFLLLMTLLVGGFVACDDDDEKIEVGNPDFTFNSETGECSREGCGESRVRLETGRKDCGG